MGSRCGCGGTDKQCNCSVVAGVNITVAGRGTKSVPYVISGAAGGTGSQTILIDNGDGTMTITVSSPTTLVDNGDTFTLTVGV